jgi:transcriptional regulator with XRE-family HTH domain
LTQRNPLLRFQRVTTSSDTPPDAHLDREVQALIDKHRGQWKAIEAATGVSYSWLSKFARGKIHNPGYATLKRLHSILTDMPAPPAMPIVVPKKKAPQKSPRARGTRARGIGTPKAMGLLEQPA